MYIDTSYHPHEVKTVIVGKNGELYALGQKVESQVIARAELLAFLKGVLIIQQQTNRKSSHILTQEMFKTQLQETLVSRKD